MADVPEWGRYPGATLYRHGMNALENSSGKTVALTVIALIAFAGNSVLARLALIDGSIGPALFTGIRLLSGAIVLLMLTGVSKTRQSGSWFGAISLLCYALFFSVAYLNLETGAGALMLFASVQITMIGWGLYRGERWSLARWIGLGLAFGGLAFWLAPSLGRPDPIATALMIISGVGWGAYSLLGRGVARPLFMTSGNFLRATLISIPILVAIVCLQGETTPSGSGIAFAIASGTLTSGLGYAVWYMALRGLSAGQAGVVQLAVPPLAAVGGIVLLSEPLTAQYVIASATIMGGIALASGWLTKKRQTDS